MFGSAILDIAIGVVFIYLLLSLMASTLNELILSQLNLRGKFLLRGLKELLNDAEGTGLVQKVYDHGLIFGLFRGSYDPKNGNNLPSYIPSRSFALALMDLIPRLGDPAATRSIPPQPLTLDPSFSSPQPTPQSGAQGATVPVTPFTGQAIQAEAASLESFREAVARLNDPKIREPLIAMVDAANNDATLLRLNIEQWFNSTMDRVSGWYKFRSQRILFLIGIILAVAVNADTLVIARNLSNDAALRQSLVASASEAAKRSSTTSATLADQRQQINSLGLSIGWLDRPDTRDSANLTEDSRLLPGSIFVRDALVTGQSQEQIAAPRFWESAWLSKAAWLTHVHILGWLLTALAVSLGAPFWFDTLNKIMVVRSTIKPAEKSGIEKSKS